MTFSSTKQIQSLTQKLEEQTQTARTLAQELAAQSHAHADASNAHADAMHAQEERMRIIEEERDLSRQTMKEMMRENEELEVEIVELRGRIERMQVEDIPTPPPPPPPVASAKVFYKFVYLLFFLFLLIFCLLFFLQSESSVALPSESALTAGAANLKKAPPVVPKSTGEIKLYFYIFYFISFVYTLALVLTNLISDARQEMLNAIQAQNITLKAVRKVNRFFFFLSFSFFLSFLVLFLDFFFFFLFGSFFFDFFFLVLTFL